MLFATLKVPLLVGGRAVFALGRARLEWNMYLESYFVVSSTECLHELCLLQQAGW